MKANKLSNNEKEILMHRLESGCIEDCFADTEELNVTFEEAEEAVKHVLSKVKNGELPLAEFSKLQLEVIADCLDGSTFFGSSEDAVANGEITRQKLTAWERAADSLEEAVSKALGRKVHCTRH